VEQLIAQQKERVRKKLLGLLASFSPSYLKALSEKVQEQVLHSPLFQEARSIAIYSPYRGEVETGLLFEQAQAEGKQITYPYIASEGHALLFYGIDSLEQLTQSSWGPLAPDLALSLQKVGMEEIDLMLIPALAYDLSGWRLGRGKGFYDRTLKGFKGIRLGIAYDFQRVSAVPHQEGDEPVQWLATETGFYQTS